MKKSLSQNIMHIGKNLKKWIGNLPVWTLIGLPTPSEICVVFDIIFTNMFYPELMDIGLLTKKSIKPSTSSKSEK